jgi:exoribonuclease R
MWKFDAKTLELLDVWFGRTIIHSTYGLHYQLAQDIMDDVVSEKDKKEKFPDYSEVREDLLSMRRIARMLRVTSSFFTPSSFFSFHSPYFIHPRRNEEYKEAH